MGSRDIGSTIELVKVPSTSDSISDPISDPNGTCIITASKIL